MRGNRHTLIALILFSAALHFAGIRGDLPYAENYDERPFVGIPYFLAVEGKWDPHYYGHPGSTMIYPLRMVFSVWISIAHSDDFMQLRSLDDLFLAHPSEYFYFGRFLSILYGIGATAALYLIARRLFGETTALWGTVLWLLSPLILEHHQIARTDAAALCFASWAVLAILRL
ncbi:MAG: glycosyltransferase family 39 protein, partial [Verrucomicrobiae bacterium]|nr:glycosyltransferase family 39 protein [Verrucomicrobiae bacterium]